MIPVTITIIDGTDNANELLIIPDSKYIPKIYIPPIIAPFNKPFLFALKFPIELPNNILIAVITIITGVINFSLISVYVNTIENINKKTIVNISEIITHFNMFI